MDVIFVMGMSGVGKSVFIKEKFPNAFVLDLLEFQKQVWPDHLPATYERIMKSYDLLKESLLENIKNHDLIVVEHTLLKAIRREFYLQDLIQNENVRIIGYFLDIEEETYIEQNLERFGNNRISLKGHYKLGKETQELPTESEGFHELHIISK